MKRYGLFLAFILLISILSSISMARFIQPDPIIADQYNPQNLNRYAYVLNNPYKYVDPNGKEIVFAVRPALGPLGAVGAHAYFQITPDNPQDFPDYGSTFYLDAAQSDGLLKSRIDAPQNSRWGEGKSSPLETPQGDTVAIRELIDLAKRSDGANIDYDLLPGGLGGKGENSNSFATTLLEGAGLNFPDDTSYKDLKPGFPRYAKGLGRVFDIENYKSSNQQKSLNDKKDNRPNRPSGGAWGWNSEIGWWRVKGT